MKDVAYFLTGCLNDEQCHSMIDDLLEVYFSFLRQALKLRQSLLNRVELEAEWRQLFPIAWIDFYRFLDGWMPDHWKINSYTGQLAADIL